MKSSILLLILLTCLGYSANAQKDIDVMSRTRLSTCPDIAYTSSVHFVQLMEQKQYDSAKLALNYWESKCGIREPVFRARVVMAFATNQNADSLIDNRSIHYLNNYQRRSEMIKSRDFSEYDYNAPYFGFVPIGQEFDDFTNSFFTIAHTTQPTGTINYLLSEFYSSNTDTLLVKIQSDEYIGTNMATQYFDVVNKYRYKPETNVAGFTGVWIPTGGIAHLGIHPLIGIQAGVKYRKVNVDFTIAFKFLKSKTGYYATRVHSDRSVVYTDKFFGGYIGIDGGYDIWYKKRNEIQLLIGVGFDGFDAIDAVNVNTSNELKAESTWTYNFNYGIGYRYYLDRSWYAGLQAKYNIVDYSRNGVVNFTGTPITINFVVGCLENYSKKHSLESLKYSWRN